MCGIVGYVGERQALPVLLDGLRRLEYRGYDSAGIAVCAADGLVATAKRAGRVEALAQATRGSAALEAARIGIGHTRWATHGRPSDANAHPHADEAGRIAVVHNGIIENHAALREALCARGHRFRSETDSEVVAHLIEEGLETASGPTPVARLRQAVQAALGQLQGSFALVILWDALPDVLVGVRQQAPLALGRSGAEHFLASDVAALLPHTRDVLVLHDGEIAVVGRDGWQLYGFDGQALAARAPERLAWDAAAAERGGYPHFMLKEICEQPAALRETLRGRITAAGPALAELGSGPVREALTAAGAAVLLGCGSAFHASLVGRQLLRAWAGLRTEAEVASEFRYGDPLVAPGDLAIAVSQSGETADTLAALREARARGAVGLAVANVVGSTLCREADAALHTLAGPEIAVCSTKAYTTQITVLTALALQIAAARGTLAPAVVAGHAADLLRLPEWAEAALGLDEQARVLAGQLAEARHCFFIGRGLDAAVATEAQLKLKEISYLHAEAYPAGELKHGTLALITHGTPVIAIFTQPHLAAKTASNAAEVAARGGRVIGLCTPELREHAASACSELLILPPVPAPFAPAIAAIPLQLLAYHTAVLRGTDVDKPRNLAKSVTVE